MPEFQGIGGELQNLISPLFPYTEVVIDKPVVYTVTTTAASIMTGQPYKWVFSFIIRLRDLSTASYVRLGNYYGQSYTLLVNGQTLEWAGNNREVSDLSKLYAICDAGTPTLEIIAAYVPLHLVGLINQSVGQGL